MRRTEARKGTLHRPRCTGRGPGIRRRLTAGYRLLAAETLAGPQVGIRIEATVLLFCDLNTRDCAQLPSMLCWGVVCWMLTRRYSREAKEAAAAGEVVL